MYSSRITRSNPTAFLFLVDQSESMAETIRFNSRVMTKAEAVAEVVSKTISELIYRCQREHSVADYFEIGVLGYSNNKITRLLHPNKDFLRVSQIAIMDKPRHKVTQNRTLPDGSNSLITNWQTEWMSAKAEGNTPMGQTLDYVYSIGASWCRKHTDSFPMIIFNITDGEASDCSESDLISKADSIKGLSTKDGNFLFVNIHINSNSNAENSCIFPNSEQELPTVKYAQLLYEMSSKMPDCYNEYISNIKKDEMQGNYRAISFNTSINDLISMLNIGSVTTSLL